MLQYWTTLLIVQTFYQQACCRLFEQVVTSLHMTNCIKPDFNSSSHRMKYSVSSSETMHSQERHRLVASCQFYRLVVKCYQVAKSLLKSGLFQACHLQTCYNLLRQLAASLLLRTSLDKQLAKVC